MSQPTSTNDSGNTAPDKKLNLQRTMVQLISFMKGFGMILGKRLQEFHG
jgi:hypothetical protein